MNQSLFLFLFCCRVLCDISPLAHDSSPTFTIALASSPPHYCSYRCHYSACSFTGSFVYILNVFDLLERISRLVSLGSLFLRSILVCLGAQMRHVARFSRACTVGYIFCFVFQYRYHLLLSFPSLMALVNTDRKSVV